MALRIKSRWHDDESERSLEEIAGALAFISWRIDKDKAINLHGEDFIYETDEQRMAVIVEYLIFQLQIVDRIAHQRLGLNEEERRQLVVTLAKHLAGHLQDNSVDLFGPGDYIQPFVEKIISAELNMQISVTATMGRPTLSCVTWDMRFNRSWERPRRTAG